MKAGNIIKMNKADNYDETDLKVYQHLIEKLMYLSFSTKPDIAFAVRLLSKCNVDSRVGHLRAAKRVVQYLKYTMHLEIMYGTSEVNPKPYGLMEYANSNYMSNPEDRKSVIGYCFFSNRKVASWCSKK